MQPDLKSIQDVFFDAMGAGWAKDAKKTVIPEMPGAKAVPFLQGDWRVLDCYFGSSVTNRSSGITTIWYADEPVWIMQYGGYYDKNVIPFLKRCLAFAYVTERKFYGGRGPEFVHDEPLFYRNQIKSRLFSKFEGEEWVYGVDEQVFGYHWYRGMSLLKD